MSQPALQTVPHPVLQLIDALEEGLRALDEERSEDAAAAFLRGEQIALQAAANDSEEPLRPEELAHAQRLHAIAEARILAARDDARARLDQIALQGRAKRLYRAYGR